MSRAKSRKNDHGVQKPKRKVGILTLDSAGTNSLKQPAPQRQSFKDKHPVLYARRKALEAKKKVEARKAAKRSRMAVEGTKDHPIDVSENFIIKVEEEVRVKCEESGTADDPIQIDMEEPARLKNCIPALKDPGKRRGFASMTKAERAQHDFREYEGARERQKYEPKKVANPLPPAGVLSIEDSASDLSEHSNNGHWTEEDGDWIEDDVDYMEDDIDYSEADVDQVADKVDCAAESDMRGDRPESDRESSRTLSLGPRSRRRTSARVPFDRLELFREAVRRLLGSGVLTIEEPIEVEALIDAANTVVAYEFGDKEVETILEQLSGSNKLTRPGMEVYLSGAFLQ